MRKILILALASALGCTFVSCFGDGGAAICGQVRDEAGNPIAGAHVYIETRPIPPRVSGQRLIASGSSLDDGCFDLVGSHVSGKLPLRFYVTKPSYKPYAGDFESGFFINNVVLVSAASA